MLIRWTDFSPQTTSPFSLFDAFQREFERSSRFLTTPLAANARRAGMIPRINLYDKGEHLYFAAEVPGCRHEDLQLEVNAEGLTLRGKREIEPPEGMTLRHKERQNAEFTRRLAWPAPVDVDQVDAALRDGMLLVKIAKAPEAKPRNIEITPV